MFVFLIAQKHPFPSVIAPVEWQGSHFYKSWTLTNSLSSDEALSTFKKQKIPYFP